MISLFSTKKSIVKTYNLKKPNSYTTEVLLTLMEKGEVSLKDFPYLASYRTIVSELRTTHGLGLLFEEREFETKYGNKGKYRVHYLNPLSPNGLEKAVGIYQKLNS